MTIGQRAPVVEAKNVLVHNDQGGLIHFTHHDPDRSHEGGWIEVGGVRYQ